MKVLNPPLLAFILSTITATALADLGGGSRSEASENAKPVPEGIADLIQSGQFDRAETLLKEFVRDEKNNPDAWNWLGYAQRNNGDLDNSLRSYNKALKLDPKHFGALEYLGELYIMRDNIYKARQQLEKLEQYCGDCEEYQELLEAIHKAESGS